MNYKLRFLLVLVSTIFLVSCTTKHVSQINVSDGDSANKLTVENSLFKAWDDFSVNNDAIVKLVVQADKMIDYKQWSDAKEKLERTLRISNSYAPALSRLSWLSLRSSALNKAIRLAQRSNNNTKSSALQKLNWTFIRDAARLIGDNDKVNAANNRLQILGEN